MTATLTRPEAIDHLRKGYSVLHQGKLVEPIQRVDNRYIPPPDMPTVDETGDMPEFVPTRNADGTLTRAGMEWIIRSGGSVMLAGPDGFPITDINDLPADVDLHAGDVAQLERVKAQQDAELERVTAQRRATEAALVKAREEAERRASQPKPEPPPQAPSAPPGFLSDAPRMGSSKGPAPEKQPVPKPKG